MSTSLQTPEAGAPPELAGRISRFTHAEQFIRELAARGGPALDEYELLDTLMKGLGELTPVQLAQLRDAFGEALSGTETMQGFAYVKPHGYPGDFEIIDRIYLERISTDPRFAAWDRYFHAQPASRAVRNRKSYFHALLDRHHKHRSGLRVLNVASGPGRCVAEWLARQPGASVEIDCVELDSSAIAHARELTTSFAPRVRFFQQNALRFVPEGDYDLIWVAGLCDYFSAPVFTRLLRRLLPGMAPGGELVAGNFSEANPTRAYMETLGEWVLHHRSPAELRQIAAAAGIAPEHVRIGAEPEGVNLFLHVTAGGSRPLAS